MTQFQPDRPFVRPETLRGESSHCSGSPRARRGPCGRQSLEPDQESRRPAQDIFDSDRFEGGVSQRRARPYVRLAALDEAVVVRSIMLAAFAEYAGALAVESCALVESLEDVQKAMERWRSDSGLREPWPRPRRAARFRPDPSAVRRAGRRLARLQTARHRLSDDALSGGRCAGAGSRRAHVHVRDSLPGNVGLYQSLGYELVSIDPHPRGPDRVWTMRNRRQRV